MDRARITDALGQHTEYHYDADQNLTLALYPDGSKETFGYDAAGRLKTHTDGEGHTTSYEYGQDGLPTRRTNALGHTFGYHYDKARRLVGLTNENGARYRFAYDVLDRLIAESGFDHKLTGYRYNAGNELVEQREFGDDASLAAKLMAQLGGQPVPKKDAAPLSDDLDSQTPLRITEFKRDILGRLIHTLARDNDKVQETVYGYDLDGNLVRAANRHSITCFDYNENGQLIAQHQWKVPSKEENARNVLPTAKAVTARKRLLMYWTSWRLPTIFTGTRARHTGRTWRTTASPGRSKSKNWNLTERASCRKTVC